MKLLCRPTTTIGSISIINNRLRSNPKANHFHRNSAVSLTRAVRATSCAFLTILLHPRCSSFVHPNASSFHKRSGSERNMSTFTTTRNKGVITVTPRKETEQSALVVICHGLGDSAEGFADVAENLAAQMPHVKFILPTAPTQPVTMNMGMPMPSWYDITGLDERSNENCNGIQQSQTVLQTILQTEHDRTSLPFHRMVLAGFSQGGALSLFTGMQMPSQEQKLAGIAIMSGYLPASKLFTVTPGLEATPILHCHGEADPMVQVAMARRSRQMLTEEKGALEYELKTYPGLVHSVNPEELAEVLSFLRRVLPMEGAEECRVKLKDPREMSVKELREAIRVAGIGRNAVGFTEKSEFVRLVEDHRSGKL